LLAIGADAPLTCFRWLFSRKLEAEKSAVKAA
jgi:vanillate O-demethylase monooxygenase subunit